MKILERTLEDQIFYNLLKNKVIVLMGARRIGKTILLTQIMEKLTSPYLFLNGEDFTTIELLERRSIQHYKSILGDRKVLIIDEAQKIPEIGKILKLIADGIKDIKVLVTGSSAFDITKYTGEPLTGRKKTFNMFPLSEREYIQIEGPVEQRGNLRERLIYGNYPELTNIYNLDEKADYLKDIVNDYLLKDILAFENIKNSDKILSLLRLIAFQLGGEVSYQELGTQLSMSKNTVERYLDLLSKVFVLHKVGGFSRNLRKEVTKSSKWYFYDNGLRNVIVANLNPLNLRGDVGQLWENYVISERLKSQNYERVIVNNYFWRTYDQQKIDWVEERNGRLFAYEFKWNPNKKISSPSIWKKAYPKSYFEVITPDNFLDWI